MYSTLSYLISGATAPTTGTVAVLGMDHFSLGLITSSFGTSPATGTINIQTRLEPSSPYLTVKSYSVTDNSGLFYQFDGPIESLRATLNPFTTGTYTVVCRYS